MGVRSRRLIASLALVGISCALSGCNQPDGKAPAELVEIRGNLAVLQDDYVKLADRLVALEMERAIESNKSQSFDISMRGYGRIDHNNGFLFISLVDVKPKGDGHEIIFKFGNPLEVTYTGISFRATWGPRIPKGLKGTDLVRALGERKEKLQSMDISLSETLQPGSWNRVTFVVAPAPAESMGYIEISDVKTDQLALRSR